MPQSRVKGTAVLGIFEALETTRGLAFQESVLASLSPTLRDALRNREVIASGWYPIAWHCELLGAALRLSNRETVRQICRVATRTNMTRVHRLLMQMITPEVLIRRSETVFQASFDGKVAVTSVAPKVVRVRWHECEGFDRVLWFGIIASLEELVALTGAQLISIQLISGGGDGDSEATVETSWR